MRPGPMSESVRLNVQSTASGAGLKSVVRESDTASPAALETRIELDALVKLLRPLLAPNESHCPFVPASASLDSGWPGEKMVAGSAGAAPTTMRTVASSGGIHETLLPSIRH